MLQIIEAANALNYEFNEKGVCYGIACMAAQIALEQPPGDNNNLRKFYDRVKLIQSFGTAQEFATRVDQSLKKRFQKEDLSEEEALLVDMNAFFDGIAMYQGDREFVDKIKAPSTQSYTFAGSLFNVDGLKENKVPFVGLYQEEQLHRLLTDERQIYLISTIGHILCIISTGDKWLTVDHDEIFWSDRDRVIEHLKIYGDALGLVCGTRKFIGYQSAGDADLRLEVQSKGVGILDMKFLFLALRCGDSDSVNAFVSRTTRLRLPVESKAKILACKGPSGTPGLNIALGLGNADSVEKFVKLVCCSDLPDDKKVELLDCKSTDGVCGICRALVKGHVDTVEKFVSEVCGSDLPNELKKKLLTCKLPGGTSALDIALVEGYSDVVRTFIDTISRSNLPDEIKEQLTLLECRMPSPRRT